MMEKKSLDIIENDYANKNMGIDDYSLIKDSQFKSHRINFFLFYQNYENPIIQNVL